MGCRWGSAQQKGYYSFQCLVPPLRLWSVSWTSPRRSWTMLVTRASISADSFLLAPRKWSNVFDSYMEVYDLWRGFRIVGRFGGGTDVGERYFIQPEWTNLRHTEWNFPCRKKTYHLVGQSNNCLIQDSCILDVRRIPKLCPTRVAIPLQKKCVASLV